MRKATPDRQTSIEATDVDGESGGGAHFVTAARVKQAGDVLFLVVGQVSGERRPVLQLLDAQRQLRRADHAGFRRCEQRGDHLPEFGEIPWPAVVS